MQKTIAQQIVRGSECYKYDWTKGRQMWRLEEEFNKDAVCYKFYSNYMAVILPKKIWKVWRLQNKMTSNSHCNMQMSMWYWLRKKGTSGHDWGTYESGRGSGMEMNVEIPKVMRISKEPSPGQVMTDDNQLENVEYFNYQGSMIINVEGAHVKVNPGMPWHKQHSTRRRIFSPANCT